jgi:hypothetical protein
MVVLIDAEPGAGALDPAAANELACLGVTSVTLLQDEAGLGVVLEGWAFDPVRAGEQAIAIVAGSRGRARALRPLLHAAVSGAPALASVTAPRGDRR